MFAKKGWAAAKIALCWVCTEWTDPKDELCEELKWDEWDAEECLLFALIATTLVPDLHVGWGPTTAITPVTSTRPINWRSDHAISGQRWQQHYKHYFCNNSLYVRQVIVTYDRRKASAIASTQWRLRLSQTQSHYNSTSTPLQPNHCRLTAKTNPSNNYYH